MSDDVNLSFPDNIAKADVNLTNFSDIDVIGMGGGSVNIDARNVNIEAGELNPSLIRAGVTADSTSPKATAGNITLNADNNLTIDNSSILNELEAGGIEMQEISILLLIL